MAVLSVGWAVAARFAAKSGRARASPVIRHAGKASVAAFNVTGGGALALIILLHLKAIELVTPNKRAA